MIHYKPCVAQPGDLCVSHVAAQGHGTLQTQTSPWGLMLMLAMECFPTIMRDQSGTVFRQFAVCLESTPRLVAPMFQNLT